MTESNQQSQETEAQPLTAEDRAAMQAREEAIFSQFKDEIVKQVLAELEAQKPAPQAPAPPKPSQGRIVIFVADADTRNTLLDGNHNDRAGAFDLAPAVIVRVWDEASDYVNLKLLGDGPGNPWVTSVHYDGSDNPAPRTWHWPPRT